MPVCSVSAVVRRLRTIERHDDPQAMRAAALEAVHALGEGDGGIYYGAVDTPDGPRISAWLARGDERVGGLCESLFLHNGERHPELLAAVRPEMAPPLARRTFLEDEALYSRERFESFSIVRDFFLPRRVDHQQRLLAFSGDTFVGWIGLMRMRGSRPFARRERARLASLVEPVTSLLAVAHAVEHQSAPEEPGQVVLRPDGSVEYASASGVAWLEVAGCRDALAHAACAADGGRQELGRIAVGPAFARVVRLDGGGLVRYLAVIERPAPIKSRPEALLTPTQRQVAHLAARGLTTAEIALELGCASETARAHLKEIYRRLEVSSRAELALAFAQA